MNLLIHDLGQEEWKKIEAEYAGWDVVSAAEPFRPCVGCFGCWNRTPGVCVIRDGLEDMGARIHRAGEVKVISRYTFGGFSGGVKSVFDRCLGYVLPQFEVVDGETHHQKRYDEEKPFTFLFYGPSLTEEQRAEALRYVTAVCANIRGFVKDVRFRECPEGPLPEREAKPCRTGRTVLLIGSLRGSRSNSGRLARELAGRLSPEPEIVTIRECLNAPEGPVAALADAETLILCMPLYVDGLPSLMIRLLERFEREYTGGPKKVYVLANMGLYESSQLKNLFAAVRRWCERMDFRFGGGVGVSAGELAGVLMQFIPFRFGPTRTMSKGLDRLAKAAAGGKRMPEVFAEPWAFPRPLYILIANRNWNRTARANGLKPADLYRRL